MKKVLIATGVAVLAFASVAGAQGYMFNTNLMVGSTGADVSALQSWLIGNGFNIPAIASGAAAKGYFGAQTAAAVKLYQSSRGIPNTGFVGPLTRTALNGGSSAVTTNPGFVCPPGYQCIAPGNTNPSVPSTGGLSGTDGTISDVDELSSYNNEEVGDGQSDVKVLGMEVEASNDGDVRIKSLKVVFNGASNTGSDNLDDYIDGVSVWMGSTKVGSADVSSFNDDGSSIWSKTITLSSSAVIRADKREKFYVAVDSVSNLDSGDISGDAWTVDVDAIRFEDGSGVTTSDTTTGDIDGMDVPIAFVSFSSAADTELKFSTDSSSPESSIVVVDDSDNTDNVLMLVGKVEVEGTSDVVVDEIPVTLTTVLGDSVAAIANSVTLKIDGEEYSKSVTISAAQTGSVTFDNLDLTLDAGKTYKFMVYADINDIENTGVTATDFDAGDDLKISFTSTNRNYVDAENSEGDQLSDSTEKSGTVNGEAQEFRTNGIGLTLISTNETITSGNSSNDDTGLFTIKFKVTAIGDAIYISSLSTSAGVTYAVDKGGTATTANTITAAIVNNTDNTKTSVGNFLIEEGDSEDFTLSVSVPLGTGGTTGQYRAALTGLKWDTTDDTSMDNTYSSDLDSFVTDYVVLN